jgi:hypothetical protein
MQLTKLIISIALGIFKYIIFANCVMTFGGDGYNNFLVGNKLYYTNKIGSNFFYVDLTDLSLDVNTVIDRTKWIDLTVIRPQPLNLFSSLSSYPLLSGKDNDKLYFFNTDTNSNQINIFDTKLNKWETMDQELQGFLKLIQIPDFWRISEDWATDRKIGKSYTFQSTSKGVSIFDSINLELTQSASNPANLFGKFVSFSDFAQVMLPNGQVLFIGGIIINKVQSMGSILIYDTITDAWQIMVRKSFIYCNV